MAVNGIRRQPQPEIRGIATFWALKRFLSLFSLNHFLTFVTQQRGPQDILEA